jgi:hypothetical protein
MSIQGVGSQRPAVQPLQTQNVGFAQPAQQAQQADPLAALTKALEALEQAVQSLSTKGFNNNQSVAQQAGQNLGQSGGSATNNTANQFNWQNLLGGGSTFDQQNAAPTPPVQQNNAGTRPTNDFLGAAGGGAGPVQTTQAPHHDNGLHLGDERSGGGGSGIRVGSDGANNIR